MGAQRTSFAKLQRERAKKAKAAAKRERRLERDTAGPSEDLPPLDEGHLSAAQLLERVEQIHRQFQAKQITHEEYEEKKAELLARLPID